LILGPSNYERSYEAVCDTGSKAVWRFFDWQTVTPGANSKIEFYAQTSATGTDFAIVPVYPAAVSLPGVIYLGTATGASITTWTGSDVGALLVAAGLKSQRYLKVTIRMVPNDALTASPHSRLGVRTSAVCRQNEPLSLPRDGCRALLRWRMLFGLE
jgi:hypothetical protein